MQSFAKSGKLELFSPIRGIKYWDIEGIVLSDGSQALTISQIAKRFHLCEFGVNAVKAKAIEEMEWVQVNLDNSNCIVDSVIINNYNDYLQLCYIAWEKAHSGYAQIELRKVKQARARHELRIELKQLKQNRAKNKPEIEEQIEKTKIEKQIEEKSYPEKKVQLKLQKSLGGAIEVFCLGGRIDLLTDTELIEVKEARQWKSALGQLLVYSIYYPSHTIRMHLYGEKKEPFLSSAKKHCSRFNIKVTFEE